jgi:hypothetical protein
MSRSRRAREVQDPATVWPIPMGSRQRARAIFSCQFQQVLVRYRMLRMTTGTTFFCESLASRLRSKTRFSKYFVISH